jgi:Uma2 family endonuclease
MNVMTRELPLCEQDEAAPHPSRNYATVLRAVYAEIDPPEGYRVEIVEGQITVSPTPAPMHAYIIGLIRSAVDPALSEEFGAYENLSCEEPEVDCYIPDLAVWPRELLRTETRWALPGEECLLAVEVTSPKQAKRDYAKAAGYARSGIAVYLLVDRQRQTCVLFTVPEGDEYRDRHEIPFGKPLTLPLETPITIDTSEF